MAARFRYSRWDGTQQGFELDADSIIKEVTDELIHHGDPNAALRRIMQQGLRDRNGKKIEGLRDTLNRLRERRKQIRESGKLGGEFDGVAQELNDIIDEERLAVDEAERKAGDSGDERRAAVARDAAMNRKLQLDMLPDDLARKVEALSHYDFQSRDAQQRFEQLVERLRQQVQQRQFEQVSSAAKSVSPEDIARMKDMMSALNEMIDRRDRGEDPQFEKFMQEFGDFFPENPSTLDELLEQLAQRMAAAQAMLNSMTPEQREELRNLMSQMLDDTDLQWQMNRLSERLQQAYPGMDWDGSQQFSGDRPMPFGEALQSIQELNDLDNLEQFLSNASSPAALQEVDLDAVRRMLGDASAESLERLAKLTETLREAGLIDQKEGRLELTPRGLRSIGKEALRDLFGRLERDALGQHRIERIGAGHERAHETKAYEYGDPFHLDLQGTLRNTLRRQGGGLPLRLQPDDFEIDQTEQLTRSSTVLMVDLSLSMPMRDNFLPAKKVAMALHSLISSQFPRDYLGLVGFSETARELRHEQLPEVSWDFVYGTNMQHGFALARSMLARQSGTKQIMMITDGEPTAHVQSDGEVFFSYPPAYVTLEATLREVLRCTREDIRINTFMLDADGGLRGFVEQLTQINKGRAFFTTPETLGEYVLVDFLEHKRSLRRSGSRRAS
ncbi:MAG: vWA domain-containing protein [Ilumatobacteraceae bacterium]